MCISRVCVSWIIWTAASKIVYLSGSTQKHCCYIYHIDNRGPRNFLYSTLTISLLQKMDGDRASASIPHKPCQNISPVISIPTCLHTSNFPLAVYFCSSYAFNSTWHPPYTLHYGKQLSNNSGAHQSLDIYNARTIIFFTSHFPYARSCFMSCMLTPKTA